MISLEFIFFRAVFKLTLTIKAEIVLYIQRRLSFFLI